MTEAERLKSAAELQRHQMMNMKSASQAIQNVAGAAYNISTRDNTGPVQFMHNDLNSLQNIAQNGLQMFQPYSIDSDWARGFGELAARAGAVQEHVFLVLQTAAGEVFNQFTAGGEMDIEEIKKGARMLYESFGLPVPGEIKVNVFENPTHYLKDGPNRLMDSVKAMKNDPNTVIIDPKWLAKSTLERAKRIADLEFPIIHIKDPIGRESREFRVSIGKMLRDLRNFDMLELSNAISSAARNVVKAQIGKSLVLSNLWLTPLSSAECWLFAKMFEFLKINAPIALLDLKSGVDLTGFYQAIELISRNTYAWMPFNGELYVCKRPMRVCVDERGRLHNTKGPAVEFPLGFELCLIEGVQVPDFVAKDTSKITQEVIDVEQNAEVRRIMLKQYPGGWNAYLKDSGATAVHTDDFGTLYIKRIGKATQESQERDVFSLLMRNQNSDRRPEVGMVKVVCPSGGREYVLPVNLRLIDRNYGTRTAKNAVTSTWRIKGNRTEPFFKKADEYDPEIET